MIKLYKIDTLKNGTERFCTQLNINKGVASFIREKNGCMKIYTQKNGGFDFYKYNKPFKIVKNIFEMKTQKL